MRIETFSNTKISKHFISHISFLGKLLKEVLYYNDVINKEIKMGD